MRILPSSRSTITAALHREIRLAHYRKNASLLARRAHSNPDSISRLIRPSGNKNFRPA
jgi:hypothetical protein